MTEPQAFWTTVTGKLADGLPMRAYLASYAGKLWSASLHDDLHPKSEDEFLWHLGPGLQWARSSDGLTDVVTQVLEYFAGYRQALDLPVHLEGTAFQKRVWQHLMEIGYGETLSYGELAEKIGHPAAFRAVGNANGKNRICLVVPCHRVIAAGGKIGGYTGGLGLKRRLLAHEAAVSGKSQDQNLAIRPIPPAIRTAPAIRHPFTA